MGSGMQEAGMDADALAEEADDDEDEGAEPEDNFHSLRHVMPYAREAARAIDCVQAAAESGQRRRRLGGTAAVLQRCPCKKSCSEAW